MLRVLFAVSGTFLLTIGFTPLIQRLAVLVGAFDHPNEARRVHLTTMPRLGGAAICLSICVAWCGLAWFDAAWLATGNLLLAAAPVFLLGVVDDIRGVSERWKLIVPGGCAALLYGFGWRVTSLSLWPGLTVELPAWLGLTLTLLWLVGMTNAFNLIDGLDGLAVGIAAICTAGLWVGSGLTGQSESLVLSALLLGALLGFLPYNFFPARIFLGDSGSLVLGFVLAALTLRGTAVTGGTVSLAAPILLGQPLVEAAVTLLRRWLAGQPLLPGDRGHFHHKLLELGLSQRQAVLRLYAVGLVFAASGLLLLRAGKGLTISALILLAIGIVCGVRALPYEEFGWNKEESGKVEESPEKSREV